MNEKKLSELGKRPNMINKKKDISQDNKVDTTKAQGNLSGKELYETIFINALEGDQKSERTQNSEMTHKIKENLEKSGEDLNIRKVQKEGKKGLEVKKKLTSENNIENNKSEINSNLKEETDESVGEESSDIKELSEEEERTTEEETEKRSKKKNKSPTDIRKCKKDTQDYNGKNELAKIDFKDVSTDDLKKLYGKFGNYEKVINYLIEQGCDKTLHTYNISCKIRKSFSSGTAYKIWAKSVKDNIQLEILNKITREKDGEFIEGRYLGAHTPHRCFCNKHKFEWLITPTNLKEGKWCPKCWEEKNAQRLEIYHDKQRLTIEEVRKRIEKKGGKCLSEYYGKNNQDPILVECGEGHIFKITPSSLQQDHWCPICTDSIEERRTRALFEEIFQSKFPKSRPEWLKNDDGNQMHLDGYNKDLNLAFEHNGKQHYEGIPYFHKTIEDFERQQNTDLQKKELCKIHGVSLIEIPYTVKNDQKQDFIIKKCRANGIKVPRINHKIDWRDLNIHFPEKFEKNRKLAKSKGYSIITKSYAKRSDRITLKCDDCGHERIIIAKHLPDIKGCLKCIRQKKFNEYKRLVESKNGELLANEFVNVNTPLPIKCNKCGYIWSPAPSKVKRDQWCPRCINKEKHTFKQIQKYAKQNNAECLGKFRQKDKTYYIFKCNNCNHQWESTYNNMKRRQKFCINCSKIANKEKWKKYKREYYLRKKHSY